MTQLINETLPHTLQKVFENKNANLFIEPSLQIMLCETKVPYIPIEEFKDVFYNCSVTIKDAAIVKFIFDKRALRTFHQPSMEWYFISWKQDMYNNYGLATHRKILPDENWFRKCVEAGKAEILKDKRNTIISKLDIKYTESVAQAIDL